MTAVETTSSEGVQPSPPIPAVVYPRLVRVVVALLAAVAGASLLAMLVLLLLPQGRPVNPLWLIRVTTALCLLPGLALLLLRHACAGSVRIDATALVLEGRQRRVEIPIEAIAALEPWLLPIPGSGLGIRLRSGRRWPDGVETTDLPRLVRALVAAGAPPHLDSVARRPSVIYAHARSEHRWTSWRRAVAKFPLFALVPTLPLFRVHQLIAYGGAFGEYYQYGLGAYLAGFAIYWATLTIYLMVYAAALRMPVEVLAATSALLLPRHASGIRRVLERAASVLYYVGVPVAVVLRFVPW